MTEDTYQAITRVARTFRAYQLDHRPRSPEKDVGDQLYREWPELWWALDDLQKRWVE